jgi:hypothetical protein
LKATGDDVGTEGASPVFFRKHKKYPLSGGKVPFAFVKNDCNYFSLPSPTFPGKSAGYPRSFDASYAPAHFKNASKVIKLRICMVLTFNKKKHAYILKSLKKSPLPKVYLRGN